jgi:hypothetical protein
MRKLLPAIVVVVLAIGAFWYFSHRGDREGLLAYVPADTPWVLANTQPLPEHALAGLRRQLDAMTPMYPAMLHNMREALAAGGGDARTTALLEALETELADADASATYERIGMGIGPRMVFYGHGLVPVLRVVLADPDRFEAFLVRLEDAVGEALPVLAIGGHEVRRITLGDVPVEVLVAVIDDHLVATLAPRDAAGPMLQELMGLRAPGTSLASTRNLRRLNRNYGYQPNFSGYLDMRRLAEHFMAPATPIESAFLSAFGIDKPRQTPQCRAELQALSEAWPRVVLGYPRLDAKVQEARIVVEAHKDIAESLMGLRAPMPGPGGRAADSLMDIGLAMRLDALPGVVNRFADEVRANPWQCESLLVLNEGFAQLRLQMSDPGLVMAAPLLHSLYLSVEDFSQAGEGMPDVSGVLAIGSQNPAAVVSMAQAFLPQLATMGLKPDRQPRPLSLQPLLADAPVEVAMSENALAMAVGASALPRLSQALGSSGGTHQPMLHFAMGSRFYALANQAMQQQLAMLNAIDPATLAEMDEDQRREFEALRDEAARVQREFDMSMEIYARLFKRVQFELTVSQHGVELWQRMDLH